MHILYIIYFFIQAGYPPYYNPYISTMYIRKAKVEDDYNEEGEEKYEGYKGGQYGYEKNYEKNYEGGEEKSYRPIFF